MSNLRCFFYLNVFYCFIFCFTLFSVQSMKSCFEKYDISVAPDFIILFKLGALIVGLVFFVRYSYRSWSVAYVTFDTNLSVTKRKSIHYDTSYVEYILFCLLLVLIVTENTLDTNLALLLHYSTYSLNYDFPLLRISRPVSYISSFVIYFYITSIAVTPATYLICLLT